MPAFPFLLLAAFGFSRSSERLDAWFKSTKLYKNNLESYVKGQGMTLKTKLKIMIIVTILMCIGFIMMHKIALGQVVLTLVWLFHIVYFLFGVKTIKLDKQWSDKFNLEKNDHNYLIIFIAQSPSKLYHTDI